jgi:hypothetical protein
VKHKQIIKQLIRACIIGVIAVLLFGLLYYAVTDYKASIEQSIQVKNGDLIAKKNLYTTTDRRVSNVNEAYKYYLEFSNSRDSKMENFRRENANKILARIGDELSIDQLLLAMGQFKEEAPPYKKDTVSLYNSDVTVQFVSFEDISAYNLLRKIEDSFPGNVIIDKFRFQREKFTESLLIELSEGKKTGLVEGDVSFRWRGIQENTKLPLPVSNNRQGMPMPNGNPAANQRAINPAANAPTRNQPAVNQPVVNQPTVNQPVPVPGSNPVPPPVVNAAPPPNVGAQQ